MLILHYKWFNEWNLTNLQFQLAVAHCFEDIRMSTSMTMIGIFIGHMIKQYGLIYST